MDGGVSPLNNPSLQGFVYATVHGYKVNWTTGANQMLLVSVGTGAALENQAPSRIAAKGAIEALISLMDDCASLVESMMQWLPLSPTASQIDREIKDMRCDLLGGDSILRMRCPRRVTG